MVFNRRLEGPLEGDVVVDGEVTSYAFLKVFRTVGDAVELALNERERPVVEEPKVRGSEVVWRVSLGRDVMLRWLLGGGCKQDMVVLEGREGEGEHEERDDGSGEEVKGVIE